MAMADAHNNEGKTSFFGHDKGLKSYLKFEEKLKNTLLAMVMDGLLSRSDSSSIYLTKLLEVIGAWETIFPNWPDASAYAEKKFRRSPGEARSLITSLIGVNP